MTSAKPAYAGGVPRTMLSFERDEFGAWFAWLDCGHRRHVAHRPPMSVHPWIESPAARAGRIGQRIECGRCSQRIWPEGLEHYKSTKVFDASTVPTGLCTAHATRAGVWGALEVLDGAIELDFQVALGVTDTIRAGTHGVIPPEVEHHVTIVGPVRFQVHFHRPRQLA